LISQSKYVMQFRRELKKVGLPFLVHVLWGVHVTSILLDYFNLSMLWIVISDKNHGVILIPEGLVESIPELYALLQVSLSCEYNTLSYSSSLVLVTVSP
jgi:hypothetical protein